MLSIGHILISDLVAFNMFMILLYLASLFSNEDFFACITYSFLRACWCLDERQSNHWKHRDSHLLHQDSKLRTVFQPGIFCYTEFNGMECLFYKLPILWNVTL